MLTHENIFLQHPDALELVNDMTDEEIEELNRGGHDPRSTTLQKPMKLKISLPLF